MRSHCTDNQFFSNKPLRLDSNLIFSHIVGYRVEMLDIKSGQWIEITFIEGYEPKCTLKNILYGIM